MGDSFDIEKWIRFAQDDYEGAVILANRYRPQIELACFHCHQSAEKILKAYGIAKGMPFTKTHDLVLLLDKCKTHDTDFDNMRNICDVLNLYSTAGRYPQIDDLIEYDMKQALKHAQQILEFTKAKLKEIGYEYNPDKNANAITPTTEQT